MPEYSKGSIRVVAGTGVAGDGGDGGPAEQAELYSPAALCLDLAGNLYIADDSTFSIRRVDGRSGQITTVAGGLGELDDDLQDDLGLALADCAPGFMDCGAELEDGMPAKPGAIEASDLLVVGDRLLMAVPEQNRVRYLDLNSGTIHTLVGCGEAGFDGDGGPADQARLDEPSGLAVDAHGNLFVADTGNHRVRRVDARTHAITTVVGGGENNPCGSGTAVAGLDAHLSRPRHVAVEPSGWLVVASDMGVFRSDGQRIWPLAPRLSSCDELTLGVDGLACDSLGNLFFACSMSNAVVMLPVGAEDLVRVVGSGCLGTECVEMGDAIGFDLTSPRGLAVTADGVLFFLDSAQYRAYRVDFE